MSYDQHVEQMLAILATTTDAAALLVSDWLRTASSTTKISAVDEATLRTRIAEALAVAHVRCDHDAHQREQLTKRVETKTVSSQSSRGKGEIAR